ncbi:ATP-binding cassette domain-containing protein [Marinobacterium sp. xm-a-152]|uniref:ATP-binding cassette domain-containing protein n=1 Tax=Marinobacterium sp. xm-a-152 TaxID=2497733 RepID=UPI0015691E4A|nr:ATP-binding cassette domain-containing protein [Marinobacterium sp. xm-a-152]NRP16769.1 Thiamine import ATP-binding protein ThiQ [Marinobacterium sp. xm-a-152]
MSNNLGLQINNLIVSYPDWEYCYDLLVPDQSRVALLGQSGIGKTTLLLAIAGFAPIKSGEVRFNDQVITDQPPEERPVAMLFQEDNLFEHLTIQQNLRLGLDKHQNPDKRIQEAMQELDLLCYLNKMPNQLSGGQRQRIGIIRTLLRPEPIIVLDEPLTGLDSETKEKVLDWIDRQLTEQQKMLIMVTHQRSEAERLGCEIKSV